jgi:hypothetical protein
MSSLLFTTTSLPYFSLYQNDVNSWTHSSTPYTTTVTSLTIIGDGIPVWWQSSDLKLFSSAANTASSSTATTGSSISAPTQTPASSLSNGRKIGIEIGVPVAVVVILIGFLAFGYYIRRGKRHRVAQRIEDKALRGEPKGSMPVGELSNEGGLSELYSGRDQYYHHHYELSGS